MLKIKPGYLYKESLSSETGIVSYGRDP